MIQGTRTKDSSTVRYYQRIYSREIADARQNKREPEMPLEDDARTDLAWLVWHKMLTGQPVTRVVNHYDPADLRDRLRAVGIRESQYREIAGAVMVGRNVAERILYGTHSYIDHTVTPAVRRVIEWIEDAERDSWRVS